MFAFPDIDPIAISIGPVAIRWYALAYISGILGAWWYIGWLDKKASTRLLVKTQRDDMITWGIIGVMLGGRLGYVLFYNLSYFIEHPLHILQLWQGGMSFHGGALGVIMAFYIFARRQKIPYVALMDRICCAVPIGLFFGRIANFINGELYGRVTDSQWGIVFPTGGHLPRHPSQLYEATLEGLALFLILLITARLFKGLRYNGLLSGMFLAGYGAARFTVEYAREPDAHLGFIIGNFTMGQLLCIPMMLVGGALMLRALQQRKRHLYV